MKNVHLCPGEGSDGAPRPVAREAHCNGQTV